MTGLSEKAAMLELALPDAIAISDVKNEICVNRDIKIGRRKIRIPSDVDYQLVCKTLSEQRYGRGKGVFLGAIVAVGGVVDVSHNVVKPKYCFAELWYTAERKFESIKFYLYIR